MNKDVEPPCEVCGGLLPLKAIHTRRRGRHRHSCSLHRRQEKPGQPKEKSRGKSSHRRQPQQVSTSQSKRTRESRRSRQLSSNSDGQAKVTISKNRLNYELGEQFQAEKPEVLEQFQTAFAHHKAKKEVIQCGIHGDLEHTERKPNSPLQQVRCQPRQHPVSQQASVVKRKQKITQSPADTSLPCHLHQHEGNSHNESTCTRTVGHLPQEDATNFSSNPSVYMSHKVRHVATQMSCNRLLASSKQRRGSVSAEATVAVSSESGSASGKISNRGHGAVKCRHHDKCRSREISPIEPCPEVVRLYEECHLHHAEEHISVSHASQRSSSRDSRKLHTQEFHTQPQILFTCHQRVRHHSVVEHHEVCHLHQDVNHEVPAQSPISTESTKVCERCSLSEPARNELSPQITEDCKLRHRSEPPRNEVSPQINEDCKLRHHSEPVRNEFSPQITEDCKLRHHAQTYVKIKRICAQMISPRSEVISPCILHGGCGSEKLESCGICWHPKAEHVDVRKTPDEAHNTSKKGKIQGCHLHREPPSSPKCQEAKDSLVWNPGQVAKPRPCTSVRWLDRIIASQSIPPQIIREFLRGRRGWPPGAIKQKCPGCIKKPTDDSDPPRDPCSPEFDVESWNPGSSIAQSTFECVKEHYDEKLARFLMARTQIIKPIVKLSTSKEVWRSRKELQCCSECWNPTNFGRWASILQEMSKDVAAVADMSKCDTKFSSFTGHGNPNPCDTGDVNLHRPELFSTFQLHLQAQKLQSETFDRNTAIQVCGS